MAAEIPVYDRYLISVNDACQYFSLSQSALMKMLTKPEAEFTMQVGTKMLINRPKFEEFLDDQCRKMDLPAPVPAKDRYLISVEQAAKYLSVSQAHIKAMLNKDDVHFGRKIGDKVLICRHELEEYVDEHTDIALNFRRG